MVMVPLDSPSHLTRALFTSFDSFEHIPVDQCKLCCISLLLVSIYRFSFFLFWFE